MAQMDSKGQVDSRSSSNRCQRAGCHLSTWTLQLMRQTPSLLHMEPQPALLKSMIITVSEPLLRIRAM